MCTVCGCGEGETRIEGQDHDHDHGDNALDPMEARVRALLRRRDVPQQQIRELGTLSYDQKIEAFRHLDDHSAHRLVVQIVCDTVQKAAVDLEC